MDLNELQIKSIKLLASISDIQRKYLKDLGSYPITDELALEFDDAFHNIGQWHSNDPLLMEISKIDKLLDSLDTNEETWLESELDNESWSNIRNLAKSILSKIS